MGTRERSFRWVIVAAVPLGLLACGGSDTSGAFETGSAGAAGSSTGASGATGSGGRAAGSGTTGGAAGSKSTMGTGGVSTSGASGSAGSSATGGGGGAAGGAGGNAGGGGSSNSGGASGAAGGVTDASTGNAAMDAPVDRNRVPDAGCPNVFGSYDVTSATGTCGNLNKNAPQTIAGTTQACFLHFSSVVPAGIGAGNGGTTLNADGPFSGAILILGTT